MSPRFAGAVFCLFAISCAGRSVLRDASSVTDTLSDAPEAAGPSDGGPLVEKDAASDRASDTSPVTCELSKPFGPPAAPEGFTLDMDDNAIFLLDDRLSAYIAGFRDQGAGGGDIWEVRRSSVDVPFGPPIRVNVNNAADEQYPVPSHDGLRLFFTRFADPAPSVATRSSPTASFAGSTGITGLDGSEGVVFRHWLSHDDRLLYFDSIRISGRDDRDIYVADLSVSSVVSNVRALSELNTSYDDGAPVLTADGLTLYFTSRRPGGSGPDNDDIWIAHRSSPTAVFGDIRNVAELNGPGHDSVSWVSPNGCIVFFKRITGGDQNIFQAVRGS